MTNPQARAKVDILQIFAAIIGDEPQKASELLTDATFAEYPTICENHGFLEAIDALGTGNREVAVTRFSAAVADAEDKQRAEAPFLEILLALTRRQWRLAAKRFNAWKMAEFPGLKDEHAFDAAVWALDQYELRHAVTMFNFSADNVTKG